MTHSKHPNAHVDPGDMKDSSGQPYWLRAHHDWKFWIAIVLMLVAMSVYITTLDLSIRPPEVNESRTQQSIP